MFEEEQKKYSYIRTDILTVFIMIVVVFAVLAVIQYFDTTQGFTDYWSAQLYSFLLR